MAAETTNLQKGVGLLTSIYIESTNNGLRDGMRAYGNETPGKTSKHLEDCQLLPQMKGPALCYVYPAVLFCIPAKEARCNL